VTGNRRTGKKGRLAAAASLDVDQAKQKMRPADATRSQKPVDLTEVADRMRPADRKRLLDVAAWYEDRALPVSIKLEQNGGRKWVTGSVGTEAERIAERLRLHAAFGTLSQPFIDTIMGELLTIWNANGGISEKSYNAAIAIIESAAPENELEAMLVVQMIAANEAALRSTSMIGKSCFYEQSMGFGNLANKFMRTFTAQTEALARLRRGGEQVVKYVHVHEGGQAVVAGTINQHGGRSNVERAERPYGTEPTPADAALPSPDPAWNGVPIPGDAEREMSLARRQEPRSAEGEQECVEARTTVGRNEAAEALVARTSSQFGCERVTLRNPEPRSNVSPGQEDG
jgi:hypothetical protein